MYVGLSIRAVPVVPRVQNEYASASASVQLTGFEVPVVRGPRRYLPEFGPGGFGLISQIACTAIRYMQEDFKTL